MPWNTSHECICSYPLIFLLIEMNSWKCLSLAWRHSILKPFSFLVNSFGTWAHKDDYSIGIWVRWLTLECSILSSKHHEAIKFFLSPSYWSILKISLTFLVQFSYANSLVVSNIFMVHWEKIASAYPVAPTFIISTSSIALFPCPSCFRSAIFPYLNFYPFFLFPIRHVIFCRFIYVCCIFRSF